MRKFFIALLAVAILVPAGASYAAPLLIQRFHLHDFDAMILKTLGYDEASITYFRELASITESQLKDKQQYEDVGCYPFYVMRGGKPEETGFDCRSFFCVGYQKGPKQCRSIDDKPYGGVVEISRRLGLVTINDTERPFADYPASERTPEMQKQLDELTPLQCSPFYLLNFDVAVGEGYNCAEIGKYPQFSGRFSCVTDWRTKDGKQCTIPIRDDEMIIRDRIVHRMGNIRPRFPSSSRSSSSIASSVGSSASSSSVAFSASFPDVIQGKYGFTAITTLAQLGIVKGYDDGTFKPSVAVNRAEFIQLLFKGVRPEELKDENGCFPDVRKDWYSAAVCAAKRLGWVTGYANGRFAPGRTMTKAEGMKTVVTALGVPLDSSSPLPPGVLDDQWYSASIRKAMDLGLILEPTFNPLTQVTRADMAVWIFRARKVVK